MVTEDGETIKLIYPGRLNDDRGADFRDAVIATRRGLVRGDIEVHARATDWRAHRHHRDPLYNRVVLHVVLTDDAKSLTNLPSEKGVLTVALDKLVKAPFNQHPDSPSISNTPCLRATNPSARGTIGEFLDSAGVERFFAKAAGFQVDLARDEASQVLYRGIMGALGYAKNKLPFLELARRLPIGILESPGEIPDEEYLVRQQALLLGTAGLLPWRHLNQSQEDKANERWIKRWEKLYPRPTEPMPTYAWNLFKVRPSNSPVCRILAMSYLLLRYRDGGLLAGVANLVREAPVGKGHLWLEKGLTVTPHRYGAGHNRLSLLGARRAADIVVNVILPFTFAWSQLTTPPELGNKALDLYYSYPRLMVNAVERHMSLQLGLSRSLVNLARRQQGLIHIYNTLCTRGRCGSCRLSQLEAGHHIQI